MREKVRTHQRLAELAAGQYGVVTGLQLAELDYSQSAVMRAETSGRLHRIHRDVFAVGHPGLSPHGQCFAAVLARGKGALLSYRSAGWLWGLEPTLELPIEVSVRWRGHGRRPLNLHHCPALRPEDTDSNEGIQVTAMPRTLLDIASVVPRWRLERAVERAERMDLLEVSDVEKLLNDVRGHPGRGKLRAALDLSSEPEFTRSGGEKRMLRLAREAGLPRPKVNLFIEGFELDFYWEAERFAVELDSWDAHRTRKSFESDPLRHEELKLTGIEMIRITGRRLKRNPEQVAERLKILLARRRPDLRSAFALPPE
jgi:very-short-patch-repair endonuclease